MRKGSLVAVAAAVFALIGVSSAQATIVTFGLLDPVTKEVGPRLPSPPDNPLKVGVPFWAAEDNGDGTKSVYFDFLIEGWNEQTGDGEAFWIDAAGFTGPANPNVSFHTDLEYDGVLPLEVPNGGVTLNLIEMRFVGDAFPVAGTLRLFNDDFSLKDPFARLDFCTTPEPGTWAMLISGGLVGGLLAVRRRMARK